MSNFKKKKRRRNLFIILLLAVACIGLALFTKRSYFGINKESTKKHNIVKKNQVTFPDYYKTAKETENGLLEVTNPESNLVLVNKNRKLPDGYEPPDLTYPLVPLNGVPKEKTLMRKEAAHALEQLFDKADSEGIELTPVSAYRSYDRQVSLYNYYIQIHGIEWTHSYSALPGTSEHQTGLAIDVSSPSFDNKLEPEFGKTKEGLWLVKHAHEFGFIIRYPEDKQDKTLYHYESWHIRYVGIKYANYLYKHNLVLEEAMPAKKDK